MAEGVAADRPSPAPGAVFTSSALASAGQALSRRRIEFVPARASSALTAASADFQMETLNPGVESQKRVEEKVEKAAERRSGGGELHELGLDLEISSKITFRRIGAGLANLGNTCFLNSVLQCLTYTEPFAAYLQSGKHKSSCHTSGFCAMCALQNHVMSALQSSGKILTPLHLVKNLRCISRNFRNARQEDAHEYMVNLLESVHKCCLPSGVPSGSPNAYEKSLVHKIFGGRLRSQVKCTQCNYCSNKFDPFLDLSLEIMKADSVHKALSHFTSIEKLDGGDQYMCQCCKRKVRALKQLTVHKAPYVLTIHLKRFEDIIGHKIDRNVDFPPTLDLKPYVSDPDEGNLQYTLYGVLVHAGWSTHSGHYYCYVRTSSGLWHSLNDNQVSQVSEKVVLRQKAYMLFYIRNRRSAPKRSFDGICKENIARDISENTRLSNPSCDLKKTIQNCVMDRSLSTVHHHPLNLKGDAAPAKIISQESASAEKSVAKQSSSFKGDNVERKASVLQSRGHVENTLHQGQVKHTSDSTLGIPSLKKESSTNSGSSLDASDQFAGECLTESDSSKENKCQMLVKNLVFSLSNANKGMFLAVNQKRLTDAAPKSQNSGFTICGSRSHDIDKKSFDNCVQRMAADNMVARCSSYMKSETTKTVKLSDQSRNKDDPLFGRALRPNSVSEPENSNIDAKHQRDTLGVKDNILANEGVVINSSDGSATRTPPDACVSGETEKTETKSNMRAKYSCKKIRHFGSKQLLFASLSLRKKKLKRCKKKNLGKKNFTKREIIEEISVSSDKETSTSEMTNKIEVQEARLSQKQTHASPKRKKDEIVSRADGCKNDRSDQHSGFRSFQDDRLLASSSVSCAGFRQNPYQIEIKSDIPERNSTHDIMNFLTRGIEDRVPKWDEGEQQNTIYAPTEAPLASIGHVLDEWDEEYDMGKRKKLKKGDHFSIGINHFEEIQVHNEQLKRKRMMRLDSSSRGNQPLRI